MAMPEPQTESQAATATTAHCHSLPAGGTWTMTTIWARHATTTEIFRQRVVELVPLRLQCHRSFMLASQHGGEMFLGLRMDRMSRVAFRQRRVMPTIFQRR